MTEKINLNLNDFTITFKISKNSSDEIKIKFYVAFFNRFPELIEDNSSYELFLLFEKIFPKEKNLIQLYDNAQKFINAINNTKFETIPKIYKELLKEESVLYIHSCARIISDFIFKTTNQDVFLIIDNIINKINNIFKFDKYIIPWYDYTPQKIQDDNFELSKIDEKDIDKNFLDYFISLSENKTNFIFRTSDKISIEDDLKLQKILAHAYFNSIPEEQNLIPYLLNKISKENNYSVFEIQSFIPLNEEYAINFIFNANFINNKIIFNEKKSSFFNLISKSLGAYFCNTEKDSNLFIRAINPNIDILSYNKDMTKEIHKFSEIYGFFFNKDFSYGLTKNETKKILEHDLYTLKYKKHKPGTFYADALDIFAQYATDKSISLILGDVKIAYNN
jgi:hypothetical protein